MRTCSNQYYGFFFGCVFFPYKKKVVQNVAFVTILIISDKAVRFMFCRNAFKSGFQQIFNKLLKGNKILLGTLFKPFQILFKLTGILKGIHLNAVEKSVGTICLEHLSFLDILNSFSGCFVRRLFNLHKTIITGVILKELQEPFCFFALIVNIYNIRCHNF